MVLGSGVEECFGILQLRQPLDAVRNRERRTVEERLLHEWRFAILQLRLVSRPSTAASHAFEEYDEYSLRCHDGTQ